MALTDPQLLVIAQSLKVLMQKHLESAQGQTAYPDATVITLRTSLSAIITALGGT